MKRFLLPLLLLLLTACSPQSLSGQVTEVITGPDGTLTALVIETDAHEERGLLITRETMLFSHLDGVSQELLLAQELPELIVSAECERRPAPFRGSPSTKPIWRIPSWPTARRWSFG